MKKRLGITLLEIMVAMACMGLIIFTGWSILHNVMNQSASAIGNVATQTEAKHIVESMVSIVKNASELEILNDMPTTVDGKSKYLYTKDGVVYYFDGIADVVIDVSGNDNNELTFSGDTGQDILDYAIKSVKGEEEYRSNSSVILNNLEDSIINNADSGVGHCIRFKSESNIALMVEFNLLKTNNRNIDGDIVGYVANGYIEMWINSDTDITSLKPSVKFFGDRVVVSDIQLTDEQAMTKTAENEINNYELEPREIDFSSFVYYYVIKNDIVKEYRVAVNYNDTMSVEITQDSVPIAGEKVIVFDEDFVAKVHSSDTMGTYEWYVQGVSKPIKVDRNVRQSVLTVNQLADHNNQNSEIEGGIESKKYDKENPNDNEDAMLYLTVLFKPEGSTRPYKADPVLVYPVSRENLQKEFNNFYFKIATDVWVESRMKEETKDPITLKSGKDMAEEFVRLYEINTRKAYDSKSVKLNDKAATDLNKTKYTENGDIAYADVTVSQNYGYDKAPNLVRTMYKIEQLGINNYKIVPTILTYGDNTTSTASKIKVSDKKYSDAPYTRTAFSIDVEHFMNNVNTLSNGNKISDISELDMYEFEVTYQPAKLESVNNKELDIDENLDIKKLSVGVFNDEDGNGFRYMTGSGAEPQLAKGYLKVVGYSGILTTTDMYSTGALAPTESANVEYANYLQEYVLDNNLKTPESITLKVNTIRNPSNFYSNGLEQGKSINTYVEILKDGTAVTGQLPSVSNIGISMSVDNISKNLFTSKLSNDNLKYSIIGSGTNPTYMHSPINAVETLIPKRQTTVDASSSTAGYGMPSYVGTAYAVSYDKMLIGENLYPNTKVAKISGNPVRTNTTRGQSDRTFGANTMGNYITVGSANDSHDSNGNARSTSGTNADTSLDKDQYAHYISDFKLGAGYGSDPIKISSAQIIGNLKVSGTDVTIVEMEFNKPIRGGYGPELYKPNGTDHAHIDGSILDSLKSKIGQSIDKVLIDSWGDFNTGNNWKLPAIEPYYSNGYAMYEPNLNAKDIKIKELNADGTMGTTEYSIYRNDNTVMSPNYPDRIGTEHYIYKTGENKLVALVNGKLDIDTSYGVEFKRGAVQAMVGGAVPIENGRIGEGEVVNDNMAWNAIPDGFEMGENGKYVLTIDNVNTGEYVFGDISVDGESIWLRAAVEYYRNIGYGEDDLRNPVNMKDGFVVTIKSMEKANPVSWHSGGFTGIGIYDSTNNDTGYAVVISDFFGEGSANYDQLQYAKEYGYESLGVHSIVDHTPIDFMGDKVQEGEYASQVINITSGKAYYTRVGGKYYTYKATFKGQNIKLEVFNEADVLISERNVDIPDVQYDLQKDLIFNKMDIQSGSKDTYFKQISIGYLE